MRSSEEITMRCKLVLDQPDIILLVEKSSSPTSAYDMVKGAGGGRRESKSSEMAWDFTPGLRRRIYQAYQEHNTRPRNRRHGKGRNK